MAVKKILVTGSEGYIGSVLVPKLLAKRYDITGLDVDFFKDSRATNDRISYIKIKKDIRNVSIKDVEGFDAIVHLSALSNDPLGEINPSLTDEINYKASVRLARLAKKAGVKKFIFSSSCSIYGIAKSGIVDEKSKVNPLTAYAKSKIKTERALAKLADSKFFVGLMRNSTVYGFSPKFRNDLVLNNLVTSAIVSGEIRILSDGTPWRPLIDVRDLSDIFIAFVETEKKGINGKVMNVGFPENNFQVKDLAEAVRKNLPECKIVITGEHGKDSRSYRVKFTAFERSFSHIKQKWTLNESVKDLINNLKKKNTVKKDILSGKFSRIEILKKLLKEKKINEDLFFVP